MHGSECILSIVSADTSGHLCFAINDEDAAMVAVLVGGDIDLNVLTLCECVLPRIACRNLQQSHSLTTTTTFRSSRPCLFDYPNVYSGDKVLFRAALYHRLTCHSSNSSRTCSVRPVLYSAVAALSTVHSTGKPSIFA